MPYSSISDLPEAVKKLPKHGQEIFLAAFNSAYKQYNSEEKAFAVAWSAVERSYHKSGDTWVKNKEEQKLAMFMNVEFLQANHEAILQTLNRDIGGYYFPSETFAHNVQDWSGIPIVYAIDHPDLKVFAENPQLALDKIKGRIVGHVKTPRIEIVGHPRLMANMEIIDEEINKLISEGKISHSTGFIGAIDGKNVIGVKPNHVLVFLEDAKNLPKDRGALILNKEDGTVIETEEDIQIENVDKKPYGDVEYADPGYQEDGVKRYPLDTEKHVRAAWSYINMPKNQKAYTADQLEKIKAKIKSAAKKLGIEISNKETETKMTEDKENELTKQLEISNKEKETMKSELVNRDETIKQLDISNKELKEQLKVFEQKEAERVKTLTESRWQTIVNSLPKGVREGDKDAKLKAEFETDPQAFTLRLLEIKNTESKIIAGLHGEEGAAIVNSDPNQEGAIRADLTKLGIPRIEFRSGSELKEVI